MVCNVNAGAPGKARPLTMIGGAPFRNWELYFESSEFSNASATTRIIYRMLEALRNGRVPIDKDHIEEYGFVELSFDLVRRELCAEELTELYAEHPEKLIKALGLAVCEVAYEHERTTKQVHARLIPSPNIKSTPFRALKAALIGKMLVVKGNVVKATSIRPKVTQLAFMCLRCLQTHPHRIVDGVFRNPPRCPTNGCPSKQFRPERDSVDTHCVNWQKIKIQEVVDDLGDDPDGESGRVPRTVEVELENDLVDAVAPGDIVTIHGLLKAADVSEGRAQSSPAYAVYIEANWLRKEKDDIHRNSSSAAETDALIRSLSCSKDLVPLLVSSFCPAIYGHVLVKFGILLTLFGGSPRGGGSRARQSFSVRTDPHLLLLGDPGLGKSQLITAAAAISPRGLYVCGNTCTASGLTAMLHHEGASGEYGLEAGALVLADRGACCIDEFDKVADPAVLLDVMEQQQVNVAKAGIVCALPARTSVIAAANPIGGHYNRSKSLLANLKMDPALVSRFDLVFVLLDCPNAELDKMLSDRVLSSFNNARTAGKALDNHTDNLPAATQVNQRQPPENLYCRLTTFKDPKPPNPLSHHQLRQVIGYAKAIITPKMSTEAAELLKAFYLELRQTHRSQHDDNLLPITTRHLESLIRLAEARAKMEFRTSVLASDAQDVIDLVRYCMYDFLSAGSNTTSMSAEAGKRNRGSGRTALLKRFISELIQISTNTGEAMFSETQLRELHSTLQMAAVYPFSELIESLNQHAYIIKRGSGMYKLCVT